MGRPENTGNPLVHAALDGLCSGVIQPAAPGVDSNSEVKVLGPRWKQS
jgi:hypothetical protein